MKSINKVTLIGHTGNAIESRRLDNLDLCCNFSLATNYTSKSDEKKIKTEWHRIVAYGKNAELLMQSPEKGQRLYVEGYLQTRQYEKEGVNHSITEIVLLDFVWLDSRKSENDENSMEFQNEMPPNDEELPF